MQKQSGCWILFGSHPITPRTKTSLPVIVQQQSISAQMCFIKLIFFGFSGMEKQKNKNFNKEYYCRNIRRCKTCGGCRICFDRKISPGTDESLGTYLLHEAPSQTQDASFNEVVSGEHCAPPFSLSVNSSAFVWTSDESRQHNRFPRSFALMKTPRWGANVSRVWRLSGIHDTRFYSAVTFAAVVKATSSGFIFKTQNAEYQFNLSGQAEFAGPSVTKRSGSTAVILPPTPEETC